MNEQAINTVITEYAIEVANLRVTVATLHSELEELQKEQKTEQKTEEKGEVK